MEDGTMARTTEVLDAYETAMEDLKSHYVDHPAFTSVLDVVLERLGERVSPGSEHDSLLVLGKPNAGKTTLFEELVERFPVVRNGRSFERDGLEVVCDHVPLLAFRCPGKPTPTKLVHEALKAFGYSRRDLHRLADGEDRLKFFMAGCGTKALVIDQAERATDRKGKVIQGDIGFWIQDMHDLGLTVVLLGLGRTELLVVQDQQIKRRFSIPLRLGGYEWGDLDPTSPILQSRIDFVGLVQALVDCIGIPLAAAIDLSSQAHAFKFYYACRGFSGEIKKLLRYALRVAKRKRATEIDWSILEEAFSEVAWEKDETLEMQNPFTPGFVARMPPPFLDDNLPLHPAAPRKVREVAEPERTRKPNKRERLRALEDALTKT